MKVVKSQLLALLFLTAPCLAAEAPFYYSGGKAIPLLIDKQESA